VASVDSSVIPSKFIMKKKKFKLMRDVEKDVFVFVDADVRVVCISL
jgi:hypothetical protein